MNRFLKEALLTMAIAVPVSLAVSFLAHQAKVEVSFAFYVAIGFAVGLIVGFTEICK